MDISINNEGIDISYPYEFIVDNVFHGKLKDIEFGKDHYHKDGKVGDQACSKFKLVICCDNMRWAWTTRESDPNEDQDGFHIDKDGKLVNYFEGCQGDSFQYCHKCGQKVKILPK